MESKDQLQKKISYNECKFSVVQFFFNLIDLET